MFETLIGSNFGCIDVLSKSYFNQKYHIEVINMVWQYQGLGLIKVKLLKMIRIRSGNILQVDLLID